MRYIILIPAWNAVSSSACGQFITLKKVLSEDWRKKRGSNEATLTGNTISYFIDGVPAKESEYAMRLTNICASRYEPMMPEQFPEALDWKERRHLLIRLAARLQMLKSLRTQRN